jgi:hypothetical protein
MPDPKPLSVRLVIGAIPRFKLAPTKAHTSPPSSFPAGTLVLAAFYVLPAIP